MSGPAVRYPCLPNDVTRRVRTASRNRMFHRHISAAGPSRITHVVSPLLKLMKYLATSTRRLCSSHLPLMRLGRHQF